MTFFGGNPFATTVGQRIDQATDSSLASENWALNMEICDIINETEDGPKDAVKAIRKKLQQNAGKNYTAVMYTLTVLETCVKNCGRKFHLLATNKEFVQELVKLIGPKNDPPTAVQEKVLSLIQSWADAFKGNPEMSGVSQVYHDLKQKGVEFPMTDLDAMAPIHTPIRSVHSEPENHSRVPAHPPRPIVCSNVPPPVQPTSHPPQQMSSGAAPLQTDQLAKLRRELDIVQGNMRVFGEMLTELTPGQEHPTDWELLQELAKTCKAMQCRIVDLIDKVANEEVTNELLRLNDDMNIIFLRYSRFEKNRNQVQQTVQSSKVESKVVEDSPLIDLSDQTAPDDIHLKLAGLDMGSNNVSTTLSQMNSVSAQQGRVAEDEFDMFAQSRNASYERMKQSSSTYQDNSNLEQTGTNLGVMAQTRNPEQEEYLDDQLQSERDFDEMEAWLKSQSSPSNHSQQEPVSSSEFDRFLAERASAAETIPAEATPTRSSTRRQMEKETENTLFAL